MVPSVIGPNFASLRLILHPDAQLRSIWTPATCQLEHKIRPKGFVLGHACTRIAPRVAHDAGLANVVVKAVVGMAVQPQFRRPSANLRLEVRDKAGIDRRAGELRTDTLPTWCEVRDHDSRARV